MEKERGYMEPVEEEEVGLGYMPVAAAAAAVMENS